jgi:Rrf2 family protein
MSVSQKCQYALRALFELAKRHGQGVSKIAEIAEAQAIPLRFLEVILNQLKQGGFVGSRRGNAGGYFLISSPKELTVGEVLRFIQGPLGPVDCLTEKPKERCPLYGNCVFYSMWVKADEAVSAVYDNTTFQDLVEQEAKKAAAYVPRYCI